MKEVILIAYSEIGLKGHNRPVFENCLVERLSAVAGAPRRSIERLQGRIVITPSSEEEKQRILNALPFVFGVHSFAPAQEVEADVSTLSEVCISLLSKKETDGRAFSVRAHRGVKDFPLRSSELNEKLGTAIGARFPEMHVDLTQPDYAVNVEIREGNRAFVYLEAEKRGGPGGLPVGSSGHGLLMLSGGIDSPVAGWSMLKRGMSIDAVYFHSAPFVGNKSKEKVFDLARVLARFTGEGIRVFVPPFAEIQKKIAAEAPRDMLIILFRRSMQRIAEMIAVGAGYHALITGESVGQVASQTIENMTTIEAARHASGKAQTGGQEVLTVRPLISADKAETIARAHEVGVYDISIRPYEDCCTVFLPEHPKTKTKPSEAARIEKKFSFDLGLLERRAYDTMETHTIC